MTKRFIIKRKKQKLTSVISRKPSEKIGVKHVMQTIKNRSLRIIVIVQFNVKSEHDSSVDCALGTRSGI